MTDSNEPLETLPEAARDAHRALSSLKEEIEAVDWYHQRVVACSDPELKRVLEHNRNEEMEHAAMALEWLRRTTPEWDAALRTYLFTTAPITKVEAQTTASSAKGRSESTTPPPALRLARPKR